MSSRNLVLTLTGILAAICVVVVAAITVFPDLNPLDYLFLEPPEHSARFYPDDTFLYSYGTLYPRGNQRKHMDDLWERFNENRTFRQKLEDTREEWEEKTGINIEEDVKPWLGPDFSAGILRFDANDLPITAAIVTVRDRQAAEIFLDQLTDYLEDNEGASFDGDTYQNHPTWADEFRGYGFALTEQLLISVWADEDLQDTLEEMIELATQESGPTLAETPRFREAMKELPRRRFASAYMNIEDYHYIITDDPDYEYLLPDDFTEEDTFPWASLALQWDDRAIKATAIFHTNDDIQYARVSKPSERLPETTMAYLAGTDDYDMDAWREELGRYRVDPGDVFGSPIYEMGYTPNSLPLFRASGLRSFESERDQYWDELMDKALDSFENTTDVNLETEVLDFLGRDTIAAIDEVDIEEFFENPAENPLKITLMIQHEAEMDEDLGAGLRDISNSLEDKLGIDQDPVNVGADSPARVLDLSKNIPMVKAYSPGYVLHEGFLIFGTTEEALESIVSVQKGESTALSSDQEYRRIMSLMPGNSEFEAWIDLQAIVKNTDPGDRLSRSEYRLLTTATGTAAIANYKDGENEILTAVLTFFPEP